MEIEEIRAILRKITILAGLTEQQLCRVLELLDKVTYQAGEYIFEQGQQPSHIYIIESGRVKLVAQENGACLELIVFEQGKCFGESSIIGIQPHAATAIAIEPSELMVLSR